jgi:hypothetical protein
LKAGSWESTYRIAADNSIATQIENEYETSALTLLAAGTQ